MSVPEAPVIQLESGGKTRDFDLDDAKLPGWLEDAAMTSGGYPYEKRMNIFVQKRGSDKVIQLTAETDRSVSGYFWPNSERILYQPHCLHRI